MSDTSSGIFRRKHYCEIISQGSQLSDISTTPKPTRFHRTCYTRRGQGYKYRTLATNTNITYKHNFPRDETNIPILDRKFAELNREVNSKIDIQLERTEKARVELMEKFDSIHNKISSMLDLKLQLAALQNDLTVSQNAMIQIAEKLNRIDGATDEYSQISSPSFRLPIESIGPTSKFSTLVEEEVVV